jgi:hypothetical protein
MRNAMLLAGLVWIVSILPRPTLLADERLAGPVTIRSYNTFSISLSEMETTRMIARAVFSQAGIDSRWRECRTAMRRTEADPCDDVLGADEVIVRIVTASRRSNADESLGDCYVDPQAGAVLATVFADRVHATAARVRGDAAVLLGRAVAHEVGHLLGTVQHSTRGLMRAAWSDEELRRDRERDWLFSPRQAARMREALIARLQRQTPVVAGTTPPSRRR